MSVDCPTCKAEIAIVSSDGQTGVGMCSWCGCKVLADLDEDGYVSGYKMTEPGIGDVVEIRPSYRYVYVEECEGFDGPVVIAWETHVAGELVRQVYEEHDDGPTTLSTYHGYAGKGKPKE
jgi:hypothetical protein